jgi:hypothetical protein
VPVEVARQLTHDRGYIFRGRFIWGWDAMTFGGHLTCFYVDRRAFDAAATDVNTQDFHGLPLLSSVLLSLVPAANIQCSLHPSSGARKHRAGNSGV